MIRMLLNWTLSNTWVWLPWTSKTFFTDVVEFIMVLYSDEDFQGDNIYWKYNVISKPDKNGSAVISAKWDDVHA